MSGLNKSNRGLASATLQTRREVAQKGGEAVSRNREHMATIGRKGGVRVSQDRAHMAEIGRKGGMEVSQDRAHMAEIGRKGGESGDGRHKKVHEKPAVDANPPTNWEKEPAQATPGLYNESQSHDNSDLSIVNA
jgi:general stress protein YciG